jgi:ERCC4-type nuclease
LPERRYVEFVVDYRERVCNVPRALEALEGVRIEFGALPVGDYFVDDRLLFERKTLADFVASIKDGRLFRQACRLASAEHTAAVILEGGSLKAVSHGMRREALQGALISLSFIFGIPVLRSLRAEETAKLMLYTARQVRAFSIGAVRRSGKIPKGKRRAQMFLLQGLPGVGMKRAQSLLDAFGSVEAMMGADTDELVSVEGIGTATAEAIRWVVRDRGCSRLGRED